MTRAVILKLTTGSHGSKRARAAQDLLIQGVVLQRIRREVVHVLARGQNFIAELLHVVEFIAEKLKSVASLMAISLLHVIARCVQFFCG